jgi:poly [ADP-ribose] polymerase
VAAGAAIVSSGLRIMPTSGGRCGRGLYFANESHKSGYYVRGSPDGSSIMLLAEVALGQPFPLHADSSEVQGLTKAPAGYHSTYAVGRAGPPAEGHVALPVGSGGRAALFAVAPAAVRADDEAKASRFANDEFVVYSEAQVQLRYLVRLKM